MLKYIQPMIGMRCRKNLKPGIEGWQGIAQKETDLRHRPTGSRTVPWGSYPPFLESHMSSRPWPGPS